MMDHTLSPEQARLTRPWADLVRPCRYSVAAPWMAALMRRFGIAGITLRSIAYVRPDYWTDDVGCASVLVHEAYHARDQRETGWWRYLWDYLAWRVAHPRQDIRLHPMEVDAYALGDEVGEYWRERGG